jgi:hypothetical protein
MRRRLRRGLMHRQRPHYGKPRRKPPRRQWQHCQRLQRQPSRRLLPHRRTILQKEKQQDKAAALVRAMGRPRPPLSWSMSNR